MGAVIRRRFRAAEEELARRLRRQVLDEFPVHGRVGTEVPARGCTQVFQVFRGTEIGPWLDAEQGLAWFLLHDLHLAETGPLCDEICRQEDAGDEPAVATNEEVGDA